MTTKKQIANVGGRWQFKRTTRHDLSSRRVGGDGCLFSSQIVTACHTLVKPPYALCYSVLHSVLQCCQGGVAHGRLD